MAVTAQISLIKRRRRDVTCPWKVTLILVIPIEFPLGPMQERELIFINDQVFGIKGDAKAYSAKLIAALKRSIPDIEITQTSEV